MTDGPTACATGRKRHGDRISAAVARSRMLGGRSSAVGDPYRCEECRGWHVPLTLPGQRTAADELVLPTADRAGA